MSKPREFWIKDSTLEIVDRKRASGVTAYVSRPEETYHDDPSTCFVEKSAADKLASAVQQVTDNSVISSIAIDQTLEFLKNALDEYRGME